MGNDQSVKEALLAEIRKVFSDMHREFVAISEADINKVPYEKSWTAAQLIRHVTKSVNGISGSLATIAKPATRNPAERINELRSIFLDLDKKMQSPDFIAPEDRPYRKEESVKELEHSIESLVDVCETIDLKEVVEGLPLGPITKLELLHFVLYHTQRHLSQLKKIAAALQVST